MKWEAQGKGFIANQFIRFSFPESNDPDQSKMLIGIAAPMPEGQAGWRWALCWARDGNGMKPMIIQGEAADELAAKQSAEAALEAFAAEMAAWLDQYEPRIDLGKKITREFSICK